MKSAISFFVVVLGINVAAAQDYELLAGPSHCPPAPCLPYFPIYPPGAMGTPATPGTPTSPAVPPPATTPQDPGAAATDSPFQQALASAGEGGTQPAGSRMPGFFGDLNGGVSTHRRLGRNPDVTMASGLKIAESDSPFPQDRIYYLYNGFFNNNAVGGYDVHRQLIGFEKSFLSGDLSLGMRLPIFIYGGSPFINDSFVGDLVMVAKYAVATDREAGNVVSVGMTMSLPTGGSPRFANQPDAEPRSFPVYFSPYMGYVLNLTPRLYLHGFHGIAAPSLLTIPAFVMNDVGLGFWLYRNDESSGLQAIVPTFEVHVNTPFTQRELRGSLGSGQGTPSGTINQLQTVMADSVNFTSGIYAMFSRSRLGASVSVPVAFGPHTIEALASYTYRFGGAATAPRLIPSGP